MSDPVKDLEDANALVEEADKMRGLGDAVSKVTKAFGFHECTPCAERRRKLNKRFPFTRKSK